MSLLDRAAPHVVYVQKRVRTKLDNGLPGFVPDGDPEPHRCMIQVARDWSAAEESLKGGLQILDMRVIFSRTWSGDESAHVLVPDFPLDPQSGPWGLYELVGAPGPLATRRRTAHWRITTRRIGSVADPTPPEEP